MTAAAAEAVSIHGPVTHRVGIMSGVALFGAIFLQSSVSIINYDEVGLRARFGTLAGILEPGLHFKLPFGMDYIEKVSASKIIVQEFGYRSEGNESVSEEHLSAERSMITADLNIVEIAMAIHYQVQDPIAYLSSVRDTDQFVRSSSEAIVREIVGRSQSGSLYTTSGQMIAASAKSKLQAYLDSFHTGIDVKTVEIREITPPAGVRPAFDKVNEARQERERRISEAKRTAGGEIAAAMGQAAAIRADAEAESLRRQTDANRKITEFAVFNEAYRKAPTVVKTTLYVQVMEEVLPKVKSLLLTQDNSVPPLPLLNIGLEKGE
ncbi:FtsH protease activity modulator HflK [Agrobacterium sp. 22-226-1]